MCRIWDWHLKFHSMKCPVSRKKSTRHIHLDTYLLAKFGGSNCQITTCIQHKQPHSDVDSKHGQVMTGSQLPINFEFSQNFGDKVMFHPLFWPFIPDVEYFPCVTAFLNDPWTTMPTVNFNHGLCHSKHRKILGRSQELLKPFKTATILPTPLIGSLFIVLVQV